MNRALAAAAATGVQVGAAIVASRFVLTGLAPVTLAMLCCGIGFCACGALCRSGAARGRPTCATRDLTWVAVPGVGLWLATRPTAATADGQAALR